MDVITETSLEALIQRATDPRNKNTDTAAIDAFCGIIKKEPDGALIATRLIASKIQSFQEWEAMQGLAVLEACMKNCGPCFHSEIGKFRFLNEMIKLVSPKFLGSRTPPSVRNQVLKLMHTWTINYPKEPKIKEAYDMLRKQGVIGKDDPVCASEDSRTSTPQLTQKTSPLFQDEEKNKLLQKLLRSKNPDDLQAANKLIKSMVKEDEKRVEMKSKQATELETARNNVRLLSEMLDSYKANEASSEELELIKELHQCCERLRPTVFRLAAETHDNDDMLNQVLSVSDELGQVFDKYTAIIILGKKFEKGYRENTNVDNKQVSSLLDLSTPNEEFVPLPALESKITPDVLNNSLSVLDLELGGSPLINASAAASQATATAALSLSSTSTLTSSSVQQPPAGGSTLDALSDIFGSLNTQNNSVPSLFEPVSPVFQPGKLDASKTNTNEKNSKLKALEDLDVLGETLLQQCKMDAAYATYKSLEKVPLQATEFEKGDIASQEIQATINSLKDEKPLVNGDDIMVSLSDDVLIMEDINPINTPKPTPKKVEKDVSKPLDVKPLTDVSVTLESIKPSTIAPVNVIDEKNGVTVTLHFAKDTPREDVSVIVVTTLSKNQSPISNYLFQAVVAKGCKLKLQPPSGCELPAHNPFLPPAAITQIMLIANPNKLEVTLKCMISYTMDDETVTEMGEIEKLPLTT